MKDIKAKFDNEKLQYPGEVFMFEMGDFYELFFDDAEFASKALGLTLTSRNRSEDNRIPMVGFPRHQRDGYVSKLLRLGKAVRIYDAAFNAI